MAVASIDARVDRRALAQRRDHLLSAVTAWEIALLVDTGRIELDCPVEAWVARFLDRPGITAVPLGHRAACRSYRLHHLEHRDPADRLLIATAIELACPSSPTTSASPASARGMADSTDSRSARYVLV